MRWIRSNGRDLEIRPVGEVQVRLSARARGVPLPLLDIVEEDDEARARLRLLLDTDRYERDL